MKRIGLAPLVVLLVLLGLPVTALCADVGGSVTSLTRNSAQISGSGPQGSSRPALMACPQKGWDDAIAAVEKTPDPASRRIISVCVTEALKSLEARVKALEAAQKK